MVASLSYIPPKCVKTREPEDERCVFAGLSSRISKIRERKRGKFPCEQAADK